MCHVATTAYGMQAPVAAHQALCQLRAVLPSSLVHGPLTAALQRAATAAAPATPALLAAQALSTQCVTQQATGKLRLAVALLVGVAPAQGLCCKINEVV
jgi:hypothetical protein